MKLKKLLSVILAAVMLLGCMSIPAFAADPQVLEGFSGGDGSADSPYQIGTKAQLEHLAEIVNGGNTCADTYFELTDNIGSTQAPVTTVIGGMDSAREPLLFNGHFDGKGYTVTLSIAKSPDEIKAELSGLGVQPDEEIMNMIISHPENAERFLDPLPDDVTMEQVMAILSQGPKDEDVGLFGYVGVGGEIKNVTTAGSVNGKGEVGGVCGHNGGTVTNCYNTGTVNGQSGSVGGVCGWNMEGGTITNCYNTAEVSGFNDVGGVCGGNGGTVTNCYNAGSVNGNDGVGGVCGWNIEDGTITNCYNTAEVSGFTNVGGVCGLNSATVTNCYYNSTVYSGNVSGWGDQGTANYGLPTEQCKGAAGTPDALVDKLNGYTDTETGKYPEDWETWVIGADGYPTFESEPESTFLTSFTLSKDYFDKYSTTDPKAKTDAVTDTVTFTITPITTGAPTFGTVTVNVASGVGSTDVTLPTYDKAGEYWYSITESAGNTAGVTYDTASTYYLHVIVDNESGVFGVRSAQIHLTDSTEYDPEDEDDKITVISNEYGEGTLTVTQNVTFNGEESDNDTAEFTETVTFTLPEGKEITGDVTYGEGDNTVTITPEMWSNGTYTVDITLKNGGSVTFNGLPDGTTYTVSQKTADEAFDLESVAFDNADETGDSVTSNVANGTIGDAADTVTITNAGYTPLDVGVILENGAFIILALGAIALGVWLVIAKRKNRESVDAE